MAMSWAAAAGSVRSLTSSVSRTALKRSIAASCADITRFGNVTVHAEASRLPFSLHARHMCTSGPSFGATLDVDDLFGNATPVSNTKPAGNEYFEEDELPQTLEDLEAELEDFGELSGFGGRDSSAMQLKRAGLMYTKAELALNPSLERLGKYHKRILEAIANKSFSKVYKQYKRMRSKGLQPDDRTFSLLLEAAGRAKRPDLMFKFMQHMEVDRIAPTTTTFNVLIRSLGRLGFLDQAVQMYKVMRKDSDEFETRPNGTTYTALMRAAVLNNNVEMAFKYFNVMVHENFQPEEVHFFMLLKAVFEAKNYEYASHVFKTMSNYQRFFVPSLELCEFLEQECLTGRLLGPELWQIVKRRTDLYPEVPLSAERFRAVFDVLVQQDLHNEARMLVVAARSSGADESAVDAMSTLAAEFPHQELQEDLPWGPDGTLTSGFDGNEFWADEDSGAEDATGDAAGGFLAARRGRGGPKRGGGNRGNRGGPPGGRGGPAGGRGGAANNRARRR